MEFALDRVNSKIGALSLLSDGRALRALEFVDCEDRMIRHLRRLGPQARWRDADDPQGFSSCLRAFLDGRLEAIDEIPVAPQGSAFQHAVWTALRRIPAGETRSYGDLAAQLGRPAASRAVGRANGSNPVAIVIPCHRLVGSGGALTGYAGGLMRKRWLLTHEGVAVSDAMKLAASG